MLFDFIINVLDAISHRIIANHQGIIEVSSDPGQDATFAITLPL
jgi:signal transduction histidine kinase